MSRSRMIASLSAMCCFLGACVVFAVSVFPLKAAPRPQNPSQTKTAAPASSPVVEANTIWTAKVKRGDMPIQVRGLAKPLASGNEVRVSLPDAMMRDVRVGQNAMVITHNGVLKGHVSSVSSGVESGASMADITLDSPLPEGTDASDAMIVIGKLENVVFVGRPAQSNAHAAGGEASIFKIVDDGKEAKRVKVHFGRASVVNIQVLSGLQPGDTVILSDMSSYDKFSSVQIKR